MEVRTNTPLAVLGALPLGEERHVADAPAWKVWGFSNGDLLMTHEGGADLILTPALVDEHGLAQVADAIQAVEDAAVLSSSSVCEVARIILGGGVLLAPRVSVGPIRPAVGDLYWACIQDPGGVELHGYHLVPCVNEHEERDDNAEDDRSPFGAARLFVALLGPIATRRALRAHHDRFAIA